MTANTANNANTNRDENKRIDTLRDKVVSCVEQVANAGRKADEGMLKVAHDIVRDGAIWHPDITAFTAGTGKYGSEKAREAKSTFLDIFLSHSSAWGDAQRKIEESDGIDKRKAQEHATRLRVSLVHIIKATAGILKFAKKNGRKPADVVYLARVKSVGVTDKAGEQHKMTLAAARKAASNGKGADGNKAGVQLSKATLVDLYSRLLQVLRTPKDLHKMSATRNDSGYDQITAYNMFLHLQSIFADESVDTATIERLVAEDKAKHSQQNKAAPKQADAA